MKKTNSILLACGVLVLGLAAWAGSTALPQNTASVEMVIARGSYLDPMGFVSAAVTSYTVAVASRAEMIIAIGSYADPMGFVSVPVTSNSVAAGGSGTQAA